MSITAIGIIVGLAVVLLVVATAFALSRRRARLRQRFGPEYERTVQARGSRLSAERDLSSREARFQELDIRPLPPVAADRYASEWQAVQRRFVDQPQASVTEAHSLLLRLMNDRGYPTGQDFDDRADLLSVEHGHVIDNYRAADRIQRANTESMATTEDLRQAMVHYRALFEDLLVSATDSGAAAYPDQQGLIGDHGGDAGAYPDAEQPGSRSPRSIDRRNGGAA